MKQINQLPIQNLIEENIVTPIKIKKNVVENVENK